jgi:hypothetical protein
MAFPVAGWPGIPAGFTGSRPGTTQAHIAPAQQNETIVA